MDDEELIFTDEDDEESGEGIWEVSTGIDFPPGTVIG